MFFILKYSIFKWCVLHNTKEGGKIKVQHSRAYYGEIFLEKEDLKETNIKHKIKLEYYTIKEEKNNKDTYRIEIVKKEYTDHTIEKQVSSKNFISNNSQKVIEIINTLKKYKVTPIGLNDVLEDLLKTN